MSLETESAPARAAAPRPYGHPLPGLTVETRPFWEWAKKHELRLPHCKKCGEIFLPPTAFCPECLSEDIDWIRASGRGTVSTWATYREAVDRRWPDVPYTVLQVKLDEGPRFTTQLVGARAEDVYMGMPVEVVFDDVTEDVTLPKFRPVKR